MYVKTLVSKFYYSSCLEKFWAITIKITPTNKEYLLFLQYWKHFTKSNNFQFKLLINENSWNNIPMKIHDCLTFSDSTHEWFQRNIFITKNAKTFRLFFPFQSFEGNYAKFGLEFGYGIYWVASLLQQSEEAINFR